MFRDFSGRKVPGVLDYQAAALDSYLEQASGAENVALQMPTGSGKTLIGLLIAEWRRRKYAERSVYLCPTNQLAKQVLLHAAQKYGMNATRFKGQKKLYRPEDKAAYESGEMIAITSYSALFNSSPYFDNANFILLDDSHVAENYIESLWSLDISAKNFPTVFDRVAAFLKDFITRKSYHSLSEISASTFDRSWADLVPMISIVDRIPELIGILDDAVDDTKLYFPWTMIRPGVLGCNVFIGAQRILIKPLVPPTLTFAPFANAKQRFFMSATLGEAGNFERMTGVSDACRLPTPPQLSKEAVGRRFFIFPGQALSEVQQQSVSIALMQAAGRSVLLVPSKEDALQAQSRLQEANLSVYSIDDLEDDKEPFTESDQSVALLAGRYDGLDFPDSESRLLIIDGMPGNFELQELFLRNKAHAAPMLEDRARTRIIQATGRCTRSENDYSAVLVLEDKLIRSFRVAESRTLLPIEIQAEAMFGLEQAKNASADSIMSQFTVFFEHSAEWQDAEDEIRGIRSDVRVADVPFQAELLASARHEVAYCYAMWQERYVEALSHAKSAIDAIISTDLRGYRAFWELQAATAAHLATLHEQGDFADQVTHMIGRASKGLVNVDWLLRLAGISLLDRRPADSASSLIENLATRIESLGISSNVRFQERISQIRELLSADDAKEFERGVLELGELLGFTAGKIEEEGTPDPWWQVNDALCFVFEAHSGGTAAKIGSGKSRQAALQASFIREKLDLSEDAEVISILLSDGKPSSEASSIYLNGVTLWNIADFRAWANRCLDTVNDLRLGYSLTPDLRWRMKAADMYVAMGIDPESLKQRCMLMRWIHKER
jgi:hypothetical protein